MSTLERATRQMHRHLIAGLTGTAPPRRGSIEAATAAALRPELATIMGAKGMNVDDLGGAYVEALAQIVARGVCGSLTQDQRSALANGSAATRKSVAQKLAKLMLTERRMEILKIVETMADMQKKANAMLAGAQS